MKRMKKRGIDAWNARVDEVIKCGPPVSEERAKVIRDMYPPMTDADIEKILKEYHSHE